MKASLTVTIHADENKEIVITKDFELRRTKLNFNDPSDKLLRDLIGEIGNRILEIGAISQ